jgi:hydroxymethylpyrimidine/phosphomethylpyrimidine kinase
LKPARLLAVAGSDSSGGAGIQADIRTASALGVYAMTAVTAVTAQDTTGIGAVHLIPAAVVHEQIVRCLSDIGADAIKIGVLGSGEIAQAVADAIAKYPAVPVVVDPVLASTSGTPLADAAVMAALKSRLFPNAAVITPNLSEAKELCGFALRTAEDLRRASAALLAFGPKAVLLKGGHGGSDTVTDFLFSPNGEPRAYIAKRVESRHTHGTGCTLATAIACGLAQGLPLGNAIQRAHDFVQTAIRTALGFGAGKGPINQIQTR